MRRFRNTEYFRIDENKIRDVEVYFGSSIKVEKEITNATRYVFHPVCASE
jgi:hypothetical protein